MGVLCPLGRSCADGRQVKKLKKATIDEVAALAGVAPSSVSRILRGVGNFAPSTVERVRKAAEQLDYSASPSAHRLATGRTGTVAIVMPYVTRWFFAEVLGGVEQVVRQADLDLLLYHVSDVEMRRNYFSSGILTKRVDGVILVTLALTEAEVRSLHDLEVPVCTLGSRVPGFSSLAVDDAEAAASAVRHLSNLGHTRIGMIAGDTQEPHRFTTELKRRAGYRQALEAAGLRFQRDLVAHGPYTVEGGHQAMTQLMSSKVPPTAVFAECDEMAFGALRALQQTGLSVPGDLSLVGFDDHPMARYFDLTTVAQEVRRQGEQVAKHLVSLINGEGRTAHVLVPTRLVLRGSTSQHHIAGLGKARGELRGSRNRLHAPSADRGARRPAAR